MIEQRRKRILDELRDIAEIDEGSDIPVHEKLAKEGKIKRIRDSGNPTY